MRKKSLILSLIVLLFVISCNKEDSIINNDDISILKFSNEEEYTTSLSKVVQLSDEELLAFENNNGYKSLGRLSEEIYKNIDMDCFGSTDEIIAYVEENNEYLQLIDDGNGELELETTFYDRADRYFLNKDKMYQIGDTVIKAFETGTVKASINDLDILKSLKSDDVNYNQDNPVYKAIANSDNGDISLKSTAGSCGTSHTWRSTNGKNRLKVKMNVYNNGGKKVKSHFIARPYKRTLRVWFYCSRTMKVDADFVVYYWDKSASGSSYERKEYPLSYYVNWQGLSKYERNQNIWCIHSGFKPSYKNYDVWADTYSVSPISQECN